MIRKGLSRVIRKLNTKTPSTLGNRFRLNQKFNCGLVGSNPGFRFFSKKDLEIEIDENKKNENENQNENQNQNENENEDNSEQEFKVSWFHVLADLMILGLFFNYWLYNNSQRISLNDDQTLFVLASKKVITIFDIF